MAIELKNRKNETFIFIALVILLLIFLFTKPYESIRSAFYIFSWENEYTNVYALLLVILLAISFFIIFFNKEIMRKMRLIIGETIEYSIYVKVNVAIIYIISGLSIVDSDVMPTLLSFFTLLIVIAIKAIYYTNKTETVVNTLGIYLSSLLLAYVISGSVLPQ